VVNAIGTIQGMSAAAGQTKNTRMKALAAATAAMAAKNAASDIAANGVSISLSLTAGHSESEQTQTTASTSHIGSTLTAGNNIAITATGGGADSNVAIIGSDVSARNNVSLRADNQVSLLAAQDLESQHSQSKSMSAAAGIAASYSSKGGSAVGITGSVSASRGTMDGEGVTQINTHIDAGAQLSIASGGDTNLKGAVASASQVIADVKGNLNIASLQDTARFDSKEQSASVSGTYGYGANVNASFSQSTVHNDYASVQEQSGIRAGDGGFQVTVGGNTVLKGGVISNSTAGVAASSLVTTTLTHSDIDNHATASASGIGIGGGFTVAGTGGDATSKDEGKIKLMNMGSSGSSVSLPSANAVSDNATGVTRSGIGAGTLIITDDVAQGGRTGQGTEQATAGISRNVVTGDDTSGRTANNFNPGAMQAELSITTMFTAATAPLAANAIGDIGKTKQDAAQRQADEYKASAANAEGQGDVQAAQAYRAKQSEFQTISDSWGDNGINRLALHAGAQGLIGGITSGSAGALSSVSGVVGGNLGQQLGKSLGEAEADRKGLQGQTRENLINTYQNTLAAVGGAVTGLAASSATGTGGQNGGFIAAAQAGNTSDTIDVFNRQLHSEEKSIAAKLAAASGGKYTADQVAAAMRASGNKKFGEDVTAGMVVPLNAGTTAKELYDTTGMLLTNAGVGHAFLVQQIPSQVDPELATYIRNNTGGSSSPYTWEPSVLGIKPAPVSVAAQNPFTPNSAGCITAECAAGIAPSFNHRAGETQFLGGLQAVGGGAQAVGGGALVGGGLAACGATFGGGCVVAAIGGLQMLSGWDNVKTGTETALDAKPHTTVGGELLQQTGLSPGAAELLYGGLQLGTGYGAIKLGTMKGLFSVAENTQSFKSAATIEGNFYRDGSIVDIGEHFGKFENGASLLAPAEILEKYSVVGRADGLFVTSPDYLSALLKRTGGDNNLIKAELGIEPQYWNGPLARVDISMPLGRNPRLPSGLESGANSLFIRGGFTPSGAPEIVIDPVPTSLVKSIPVKRR
jgi:hypothetical protein